MGTHSEYELKNTLLKKKKNDDYQLGIPFKNTTLQSFKLDYLAINI